MPDLDPQPDPDAPRLDCPKCGYNVGPTSDWQPGRISKCPECGHTFNAYRLSKEPKPQPITSGRVVWHILWPGIIVFCCSVLPLISLITMPLAVIILLIVNGMKSAKLAERMAYQRRTESQSLEVRDVGIAFLLWLAQTALMAFAVFGGCSIAVSGF